MGGKGPLQIGIWKLIAGLAVQAPHSPCSCPKIDLTDKGPGNNLQLRQTAMKI